ncbi:MAG: alpha/beta hydrolase [Acidimicrobiales bacterium]
MSELDLPADVRGVLDGMAAAGAPAIYEGSAADARLHTAAVRDLVGAGPALHRVADVTVPTRDGSVAARVYEPAAAVPGTIVYFHGGGWVIGSVDDWDAGCRVLARDSGCRVVSVEYRLAPEHRFPAAADDAYDAYLWAAEEYADGPVVVAGDSAGGNLAAVAALRARDEGAPAPRLQVLVYPVVDCDLATDSYDTYAQTHLILNRPEMEWFWDLYVPEAAERSHPYASPLRADSLAGLAPAVVVHAGHDPLRSEGVAYVARLRATGVPVEVFDHPRQIHGFYTLVGILEDADRAVAQVAGAVRRALGAPTREGASS